MMVSYIRSIDEESRPLAVAQLEYRPTPDAPIWGHFVVFLACALVGPITCIAWCLGSGKRVSSYLSEQIGRLIYALNLDPVCKRARVCVAICKARQRRLDEAEGRISGRLDRIASRWPSAGFASRRILASIKRQSAAVGRKVRDQIANSESGDDSELLWLRDIEEEAADARVHLAMLALYQSLNAFALLYELEDEALDRGKLATLLAIVAALGMLRCGPAAGIPVSIPVIRNPIAELLSPRVQAAGGNSSAFVARC